MPGSFLWLEIKGKVWKECAEKKRNKGSYGMGRWSENPIRVCRFFPQQGWVKLFQACCFAVITSMVLYNSCYTMQKTQKKEIWGWKHCLPSASVMGCLRFLEQSPLSEWKLCVQRKAFVFHWLESIMVTHRKNVESNILTDLGNLSRIMWLDCDMFHIFCCAPHQCTKLCIE